MGRVTELTCRFGSSTPMVPGWASSALTLSDPPVEHNPIYTPPPPRNSDRPYQCQGEVFVECEHGKVRWSI